MKPSESPFLCRWESFGLEDAGLADLRPRVGTYSASDFFVLPPLPFELRGDWSWLRAVKPVPSSIVSGNWEANEKALSALKDAVAAIELSLPDSFTQFFSQPDLADRVRSNTACFLDLSLGVASPPTGRGYIIRFLADSQGCLFWYLYLAANGDHAVLSSTDYYGSPSEEECFYDGAEPEVGPLARSSKRISFAAESFEAFMWRFWIENEIWFAGYEKKEMSAAGLQYVEAYRRGQRRRK